MVREAAEHPDQHSESDNQSEKERRMSIADLRAKLGYSEGEFVTQPETEKPAPARARIIWPERRLCEVTTRDQEASS